MRNTVLSALTVALGVGALAAPAAAQSAEATAGVSYIATIRTGTPGSYETFRVELADRDDIDAAFAVLRGESNQHPNGKIVRTASPVNRGYGWHLDPKDVSFVDMSMEICDGKPSYVAENWWTVDRFCPWDGTVVRMQRAPR
ncbi:BP74-related protein [Micromonospora marina]|uniref:BP74-related protein n=1 Tax=Micromonospora marina TaxID=307120 RepID=UPI003F502444